MLPHAWGHLGPWCHHWRLLRQRLSPLVPSKGPPDCGKRPSLPSWVLFSLTVPPRGWGVCPPLRPGQAGAAAQEDLAPLPGRANRWMGVQPRGGDGGRAATDPREGHRAQPLAWLAVGGDRRWLSVPRACPGDRTCSRAGAGPSARGASALHVVPAALPASLDPALASAIVLSPVTGACGP